MPRRFSFLILFVGCVLCTHARAFDDATLCEGSAIVTGTGGDTSAEGLANALRDVLVKRSGDPSLLRDPRVEPVVAKAADLVDNTLYLDRMSDLPKHDEQGTRDRPYTLIARFSPAKVDAALADLGDKPWPEPRPALLVRVTITDSRHGSFPLTSDGDNDERHRQALLAAASRYGMHLVLMPLARVDTDANVPGALVVTGTLRWSATDPGWVGEWRSGEPTGAKQWGIKGVSFDAAYRDLVWGAMAIASGHALPEGSP